MTSTARTNRRRFLKQAGTTLAAGIGIALIPSVAHASQVTCCPDSSCSMTCQGTPIKYRCTGSCPSYCTCHTNVGCYTIPC